MCVCTVEYIYHVLINIETRIDASFLHVKSQDYVV